MTTKTDRYPIPSYDQATHDLARRLAPALADVDGNPWEYVAPSTDGIDYTATAYIECGNQRLAVRVAHYGNGRAKLHGDYPRDASHRMFSNHCYPKNVRPDPRISVDPTRPADKLARDVARRLLPAYRDRLAATLVLVEREGDYAKRRDANASQVATWAAGDWRTPEDPTAADCRVTTGSRDTARVSGTFASFDRLSFDLTDPIERARAERVARALAE